jgi:hypothetical protein
VTVSGALRRFTQANKFTYNSEYQHLIMENCLNDEQGSANLYLRSAILHNVVSNFYAAK